MVLLKGLELIKGFHVRQVVYERAVISCCTRTIRLKRRLKKWQTLQIHASLRRGALLRRTTIFASPSTTKQSAPFQPTPASQGLEGGH